MKSTKRIDEDNFLFYYSNFELIYGYKEWKEFLDEKTFKELVKL